MIDDALSGNFFLTKNFFLLLNHLFSLQDSIVQFLLMDKRELERLILWKVYLQIVKSLG